MLVRDVPWNDYYGAGSPLERFVEHGGKVLRLEANLDTVTLIHYAEFRLDYPDKRRVRRERPIDGADLVAFAITWMERHFPRVEHPG